MRVDLTDKMARKSSTLPQRSRANALPGSSKIEQVSEQHRLPIQTRP